MRYILMLAVVLIVGSALGVPAQAQDDEDHDRTVTVTGEGKIEVEPDMATVRFGIVTVAEDPEAARQQNAEASREAMNAVRALDVPDRKIRLELLRLQPNREYDPETRRYEEKGYEAQRQVVVELEDLDKLPQLIADIVARGANRLDGIAYDVRDRDAVRDEALKAAVLNARQKAQLIVETLGEDLGRVLRVNEQNFSFPTPTMQLAREDLAMSAKAAPAPEPEAYAAGEIEVRVVVQATFALK